MLQICLLRGRCVALTFMRAELVERILHIFGLSQGQLIGYNTYAFQMGRGGM